MKVTKTEHAIMVRLLEGPATYRQLGRAAGVSPDGARRAATRHILTRRPVVATYCEQGPANADVLRVTDHGRALFAGAVVVDRGGRHRLLDVAALARLDGLSTAAAAAELGVSSQTVRRARARRREE